MLTSYTALPPSSRAEYLLEFYTEHFYFLGKQKQNKNNILFTFGSLLLLVSVRTGKINPFRPSISPPVPARRWLQCAQIKYDINMHAHAHTSAQSCIHAVTHAYRYTHPCTMYTSFVIRVPQIIVVVFVIERCKTVSDFLLKKMHFGQFKFVELQSFGN